MADDKKKKLPSNLDDILETEKISESYKKYDEHMKDQNQHRLFIEHFQPAQDALYKTAKVTLLGDPAAKKSGLFKSYDADLKGKKKEIQKVLSAAMISWFEKMAPATAAVAKDHYKDEELFNFLAEKYDEMHGFTGRSKEAQQNSIRMMALTLEQRGGTVGKMLEQLYVMQGTHAYSGREYLNSKHREKLFPYSSAQLYHHYWKKEIDKKGYTVGDIKTFLGQLEQDPMSFYRDLKEIDAEGGLKAANETLKEYGLKRKPADKKK